MTTTTTTKTTVAATIIATARQTPLLLTARTTRQPPAAAACLRTCPRTSPYRPPVLPAPLRQARPALFLSRRPSRPQLVAPRHLAPPARRRQACLSRRPVCPRRVCRRTSRFPRLAASRLLRRAQAPCRRPARSSRPLVWRRLPELVARLVFEGKGSKSLREIWLD